MPCFDICDADKADGGLTIDEVHATECLDFITSVGGDISLVDVDFDLFDSDGNGFVDIKEFLTCLAEYV